MINKIRLLVIILTLLNITFVLYSDESADRQIGIIYLKNAASEYLYGDYENSMELIKKAEEFYPTSSDSAYLSGLILLEKENNLVGASEFFDEAIRDDEWLLLERKKCINDLAVILFRIKKYEKVTTLVEEIYRPGKTDNDLVYLYLLSLKYLDENTKYREYLERSIKLYPDDYRFAVLMIKIDEEYREEILDEKYAFKNKEGGLDVFLKAVLLIEDDRERKNQLMEYLKRGGRSQDAFIEYHRLTGKINENDIDRMVTEGILSNPENRKKLETILFDNRLKNKISNYIDSYTGSVYYDYNDDGYYEELHLYDNGTLAGLSIDANQDGVIEQIIIFENGLPRELILSDERFTRINFRKYPEVEELSIAGNETMNVYSFFRNTVFLDFFENGNGIDKPNIDKAVISDFIGKIDEIKKSTVKITEYTGGDKKNDFTYLKQEWQRNDEDSSVLRIYNELKGNYIYLNRNEKKIAGFGDIDFDSLIDIKEEYKDGKLVSIEADDNKNGVYDFKIDIGEESNVSLWDFNEDGIFDCKQYKDNDIIITEFSTEMDGVFDIIERN